jgi:hypothetical protein
MVQDECRFGHKKAPPNGFGGAFENSLDVLGGVAFEPFGEARLGCAGTDLHVGGFAVLE